MSERLTVEERLEGNEVQSEALRVANERAERAEAELAKLRANTPGTTKTADGLNTAEHARQPLTYEAVSPDTTMNTADIEDEPGSDQAHAAEMGGTDELRKDSMMAHLLDALEAGKDIGHYGRLVFAMVARHFLPHEEVLRTLTLDRDFSDEQAVLMLKQVEGRGYNPPKRERILEWQSQQDFPILPHPDDPDCGNVYRNLKFPTEVYDHISHYQGQKLQAE